MSILDGIKLLDSLTQSEKEQFSLFCQERELSEGELVFNEGDEAGAMYILKTGKIEISKKINGREVILGDVNAEEVLGEMALFGKEFGQDECRMATAKAIVPSVLITILSFSIVELTQKHLELLDKIRKIIKERIEENKIIKSRDN